MAADGGGWNEAAAAQAEAFAALARRLDPAIRAPLAVGLSGGGDSLALLTFAIKWARLAGRRVLALTVDHGLHPDSAAWTAQAGEVARTLGADWRALRWTGPKPATGLPAAARRARHALLAEAARLAGALVLVLGHTADDVAESALIRRETPSHGWLRDWAPSPAWPEGRGVFLLRPLLGVRRAHLRQALTEHGLRWLEDPANSDPRFARTRVRSALANPVPEFPGEGRGPACCALRIGPEPGPRPSPGTSEERRAEARAEDTSSTGSLSLRVRGLSPERLKALLSVAVACTAGRETPPPGAGLRRLLARIEGGEAGTATLGGARVRFDRDTVTLRRELGRAPPAPIALTPGEPSVFDARFEVMAEAPGWRVAPLAGHAARLPRRDRAKLAAIPAAARPALPILLHETGEARLPRPFGDGPAHARELVSGRFAAAAGRIGGERDLPPNRDQRVIYGA